MIGQPVRSLLRLIARGHGPVTPLVGVRRSQGSEFDSEFLVSTPVGRAVASALKSGRVLKEAA